MPEYEITWRFTMSNDEAALEMATSMQKITKALDETDDRGSVTISLAKVMDTEGP